MPNDNIPAKLFITQTFLDTDIFNFFICDVFLAGKFTNQKGLDWKYNAENAGKNFITLQNQSRVIIPIFETKEDFWKLSAVFYQHFPQPTLLLLGDLDSYSIPLQESLLKLIEEPPYNLEIVIRAQSSSKILPTILSRCNVIPLPKEIIFQMLDCDLVEKVKKKLPPISVFAKEYLSVNSSQLILPPLKDVERTELKMWLWQVYTYLEHFYKQKTSSLIADKMIKVLIAIDLNDQNVQKKLSLCSLLI